MKLVNKLVMMVKRNRTIVAILGIVVVAAVGFASFKWFSGEQDHQEGIASGSVKPLDEEVQAKDGTPVDEQDPTGKQDEPEQNGIVTFATVLPSDATFAEVQNSRFLATRPYLDGDRELGAEELKDLVTTLNEYIEYGGRNDYGNAAILLSFLERYPHSAVKANLLMEVGDIFQLNGNFMLATDNWQQAWEESRTFESLEGSRLAEEALKRYAGVAIGTGRVDDLKSLILEMGDRDLGGVGAEVERQVIQAYKALSDSPESNVFCGFTAMNHVNELFDRAPIHPSIQEIQQQSDSLDRGLSLFDLRALATAKGGDEIKLLKQVDYGAAVPVPSIVHWNFGHYSAITGQTPFGQYLIQDEHLDFMGLIDDEVLDLQISGYFAVPSDREIPEGFRVATDDEAKAVFGSFCPHEQNPEDECSNKKGGDGSSCPMGTYSFNRFRPGLYVQDTPIAYATPYGHDISLMLQYHQRRTQSAVVAGGMGPLWSHSYQGAIDCRGDIPLYTSHTRGDGNFSRYRAYDFQSESGDRFYIKTAINFLGLGLLSEIEEFQGQYRIAIPSMAIAYRLREEEIESVAEHYERHTELLAEYRLLSKRYGSLPIGSSEWIDAGKKLVDLSVDLFKVQRRLENHYLPILREKSRVRDHPDLEMDFDRRPDFYIFRLDELRSFTRTRMRSRYQGSSELIWHAPQQKFSLNVFDHLYFDRQYDEDHPAFPSDEGQEDDSKAGYELHFQDGSYEEYFQPNGPIPSQFYLSARVDRYGNRTEVRYESSGFTPEEPSEGEEKSYVDNSLRIKEIVDAQGRATRFHYENGRFEGVFLVSRVVDPFGREAVFTYDDQGRLKTIVDPVGIKSEFLYGACDFITSLITPYGKTDFRYESTRGTEAIDEKLYLWLEAEDPEGFVERIESNEHTGFPIQSDEPVLAPSSVEVAGEEVSFMPRNDHLFYSNTYYWDKEAYHKNGPDYQFATIYNHMLKYQAIVPIVASMKKPLEGRVWYNYPGQVDQYTPGSVSSPSKVVRAVEDETGQTVWTMSQTQYNLQGNPTEMIDPYGRKRRLIYHDNHIDVFQVQVVENGQWVTLATYEDYVAHQPRKVTMSDGSVTTVSFNERGQPTGSVMSMNGEVHRVEYQYNAQGYRSAMIRDGRTLERYTYDNVGRVRTITDEDGQAVTIKYDAIDRVTKMTYPDGRFTQTVYDGILQPTAQRNLDGTWTEIVYNGNKQPVQITDSKGQLTSMQWCRCGDIKKLIDAKGQVTEWVRDVQGRVIDKIMPDSATYSYEYSPISGRLLSMTNPNDQHSSDPTVQYAYNLIGQVTEVDYRSNDTPDVSYEYDSLYRLIKQRDGFGDSRYQYHPIVSPSAGGLYEMNGPLANDTLRYQYDSQGRMNQRQLLTDSGSVQSYENRVYDFHGRVESMTGLLGKHEMTYSAKGDRLLRTDTSFNGFDLFQTQFAYGPLASGSRLAAITNRAGGDLVSTFEYQYDSANRITQWTKRFGDLTGSAPVHQSRWDLKYDPIGQLTSVSESLSGGTMGTRHRREDFGYDAAGNRIRKNVQDSAASFASFNERNQLLTDGALDRAVVEGYTTRPARVTVDGKRALTRQLPGSDQYHFQREIETHLGTNEFTVEATDALGNTLTEDHVFELDDRRVTFEYDANGNTLRKIDNESGDAVLYEWDDLNRLLAVQSHETLQIGSTRTEFAYDGDSRRIGWVEKRWDGIEWLEEVGYEYLWDGAKIIQKRRASDGAVLADYCAYGERRSGGKRYYYQRDHLGSIREVVLADGEGFHLANRFDYDAWGVREELERDEAKGIDVEFGFTGHHYDIRNELHLTWYRAYDAELGRWLSADPIAENGGLNLYAYVGNDPINFWDPLGLCKDIENRLKNLREQLQDAQKRQEQALRNRQTGWNMMQNPYGGSSGNRPGGFYSDTSGIGRKMFDGAGRDVGIINSQIADITDAILEAELDLAKCRAKKGKSRMSALDFLKRLGRAASRRFPPIFVVPPDSLPSGSSPPMA